MNLILGFAVLVAVVCMQDAVLSRTVGDFYPDASTRQHGLQVGDTILAVNGRRCFIANDVSYEFARTQQKMCIRDREKDVRLLVTQVFGKNSKELQDLLQKSRAEGTKHLSNGEFIRRIADAIREKYDLYKND